MDSSLIGKIDKAKQYADEKERFHMHSFCITMEGKNNSHTIQYDNGDWNCDCDFFKTRGRCSHTMALEIIFEGMIKESDPIQ